MIRFSGRKKTTRESKKMNNEDIICLIYATIRGPHFHFGIMKFPWRFFVCCLDAMPFKIIKIGVEKRPFMTDVIQAYLVSCHVMDKKILTQKNDQHV